MTFLRRWDKVGIVTEVKQFHQYWIRMTGSGRATLRNRKLLRKCAAPASPVTKTTPIALPPPPTSQQDTSQPLCHTSPPGIHTLDPAADGITAENNTCQSLSSPLCPLRPHRHQGHRPPLLALSCQHPSAYSRHHAAPEGSA